MSAHAAGAAPLSQPEFRPRRAAISAEIAVARAKFRPQTAVVDRGFGRKPGAPTGVPGVTDRVPGRAGPKPRWRALGFRRARAETPASRRRKARAAGAGFWGKSAVRGTENSATDHYRSPDPFMGRSFLESLQAFA